MRDGPKSEDILGLRLDRCISDTLIKTGSGAFIGIIFSVLLAKRRPWPVVFGTGLGLGMSISNCNNDFKQPLPLVTHRIKVCHFDQRRKVKAFQICDLEF
ncbi:MICOS complex subunit MIC10 [Fasciola gigantica]|uniref:MICOS complex subunit MIC10 n=1 Tax=Fasciola gigantica TaxID=46835 RepID=A0A504YRM3_FASGI|nr:MICOS complex subunit MIC10 [Fasciola gigantica]